MKIKIDVVTENNFKISSDSFYEFPIELSGKDLIKLKGLFIAHKSIIGKINTLIEKGRLKWNQANIYLMKILWY